MTLTAAFASAQEIVSRVKLHMPVSIKLHDPITSTEFILTRDNILQALVVDTPNIVIDSQTLAAMYGEMARAQRACERAAAGAERAFVGWKASVASEARAKAAKEGTKITNDAASEAYRTHADYSSKADVITYYTTLAGLFEDLKKGFDLKARMIEAQMRYFAGDMRMRKTEDNVDLNEIAADAIARSRGRGRNPSE